MSPVEQDTIDCEYLAYFLPKIKFYKRNIMQLSSKVAQNQPIMFFSVLPTGPKSAQISYSVPLKWLPARLLYNDFAYHHLTFVGNCLKSWLF